MVSLNVDISDFIYEMGVGVVILVKFLNVFIMFLKKVNFF